MECNKAKLDWKLFMEVAVAEDDDRDKMLEQLEPHLANNIREMLEAQSDPTPLLDERIHWRTSDT